jgi:CHASE1-domain containing sensor protein
VVAGRGRFPAPEERRESMMVLAEQVGRSTEYTGWYVGLAIGFVIVSVVVVLVATILTLAARIGSQARTGIEAMEEARAATASVWEIQKINVSTTAIWRAAESARKLLGG